jgi:hypothetical protein
MTTEDISMMPEGDTSETIEQSAFVLVWLD